MRGEGENLQKWTTVCQIKARRAEKTRVSEWRGCLRDTTGVRVGAGGARVSQCGGSLRCESPNPAAKTETLNY